jgi:hypothetical protein
MIARICNYLCTSFQLQNRLFSEVSMGHIRPITRKISTLKKDRRRIGDLSSLSYPYHC